MSDELESSERLALGDLLNHVLDKGVVITGDVTISVADIDLVRLGVSLFLSSVETIEGRARAPGALPSTDRGGDAPATPDAQGEDASLPVLPRPAGH